MIPDIDIYRCAGRLIEQHGEDASVFAAMNADKLLGDSDVEGYAVWKRILRAILTIQANESQPGTPVH